MPDMLPVWLVTADRRVIQLGHSQPQYSEADLNEVKSTWASFARSIGHRVAYVAICAEPPPVPGGRRPIRLPEAPGKHETRTAVHPRYVRRCSMRLVILESPYAGDVERNLRYARACMLDSLNRGEAPFASHLLYTQCLNDADPEERELGMSAGFAWGDVWMGAFGGDGGKPVARVVYQDLGISNGMREGIRRAGAHGAAVEYRTIGGEWTEAGR